MQRVIVSPFGMSQPQFNKIFTVRTLPELEHISPFELAYKYDMDIAPTPMIFPLPLIGSATGQTVTPVVPNPLEPPKPEPKPEPTPTGDQVQYSLLLDTIEEFGKIKYFLLSDNEQKEYKKNKDILDKLKANREMAGGQTMLENVIVYIAYVLDYQATEPKLPERKQDAPPYDIHLYQETQELYDNIEKNKLSDQDKVTYEYYGTILRQIGTGTYTGKDIASQLANISAWCLKISEAQRLTAVPEKPVRNKPLTSGNSRKFGNFL